MSSKAVKIISFNYPNNLWLHYQQLSSLPGFVLLQTADKKYGRYDILTAYPYAYIDIDYNLSSNEIIKDIKKQLPVKGSLSNHPFQGGAIGYITYDFGESIIGIPQKKQIFKKTIPLIDMGLYDWAIIVDHDLKKVDFIFLYDDISTSAIEDEVISLWHNITEDDNNFNEVLTFKPTISKKTYKASFDKIKEDIKKGRSYQVNYTQHFLSKLKANSWGLYQKILKHNPVPFAAYLNMRECNVLSFSPERYLLGENETLLTSPIKGTMKRCSDKMQDEKNKIQLQSCSKNRAENVMIVDLLRNDLGKISCAGTVKVRELCSVQSFKGVHHLVSDIESKLLPDLHAADAFFSCFPGGSITGAPKQESMKIIAEHEPFSRGIYCGAVAYFSRHGRFDSNITIRTMVEQDNNLYLSSGGGLVVDSDWLNEYRECYTKIAAITDAIKR